MQLFHHFNCLFSCFLYFLFVFLLFDGLEGISFTATLICLYIFPHSKESFLLCPQFAVLLAIHEPVVPIKHFFTTIDESFLLCFVEFLDQLISFLFRLGQIDLPFLLKIKEVLLLLNLKLLELGFMFFMLDFDLAKKFDLGQLPHLASSTLGLYILLLALHFLVVFT